MSPLCEVECAWCGIPGEYDPETQTVYHVDERHCSPGKERRRETQ